MEAIKGWALAVCVAAVAGSIAHLASPSGSTQKIYKITISLFFLCCILSPIITGALSGDFQIDSSMQSQTEYRTDSLQNTMEKQVEENFIASVKNITAEELNTIDVQPQEILINVNTNEESGIFITEIILSLDAKDQNKQAEIESRITQKLGQKPVMQFRQEVQAQDGTKSSDG